MTTINTPTGCDDELKSRLEGLTDEQKDKLLELLLKDKENRDTDINERTGKVRARADKIINDLAKEHVTVEDNCEMFGYKGKKVHVNLPAKGEFKGYKFEYFVSNSEVSKPDYERYPEYVEKSFSLDDIVGWLKAMNEYMEACGIKTDGEADYKNLLENIGCRSGAGYLLKNLTDLVGSYRLKDTRTEPYFQVAYNQDPIGQAYLYSKGYRFRSAYAHHPKISLNLLLKISE